MSPSKTFYGSAASRSTEPQLTQLCIHCCEELICLRDGLYALCLPAFCQQALTQHHTSAIPASCLPPLTLPSAMRAGSHTARSKELCSLQLFGFFSTMLSVIISHLTSKSKNTLITLQRDDQIFSYYHCINTCHKTCPIFTEHSWKEATERVAATLHFTLSLEELSQADKR